MAYLCAVLSVCMVIGPLLGVGAQNSAENLAASRISTCFDPGTWEQLEDNHQFEEGPFFIVGGRGPRGGVGNELVFFATEWVFAALTGRRIILETTSGIGQLCSIVHCGFPTAAQLTHKYPKKVSEAALIGAKRTTAHDMDQNLGKNITNLRLFPFLRGHGTMSHLNTWWTYHPHLASCVSHVTGCVDGDIPCAERHALQQLIRGPFVHQLAAEEEQRIRGVPPQLMQAMLELPHDQAPRIDLAIHLRVQFSHFEAGTDPHSQAARDEEEQWFNSTERVRVFDELEDMFYIKLKQSLDPQFVWLGDRDGAARDVESEPLLVYVAGDNEFVKRKFMAQLKANWRKEPLLDHCNIMYLETKDIRHIGHMAHVAAGHKDFNSGLIDTAFDWYALSLSRIVLNWRRLVKSFALQSTFVHSAVRMSGNHERSNRTSAVGHGAGSRAFSMFIDQHNVTRWQQFFEYSRRRRR